MLAASSRRKVRQAVGEFARLGSERSANTGHVSGSKDRATAFLGGGYAGGRPGGNGCAVLHCVAALRVQPGLEPPARNPQKGRDGAASEPGDPDMTLDLSSTPDATDDVPHASSPTAYLLEELQLYGYRPQSDEADPRPLPDADRAEQEIAGAVDSLAALLTGTRLEDDLDDILWSFTNLFHRKIASFDRILDDNEQAQRRSLQEQDGSEIKSVELERLTGLGVSLIERRNAFEAFRDIAAGHYEQITASVWHPRVGSQTNRRTLTAAMIDSRDFLAAKRRAEIEPLLPAGPRIAFTGGIDCNDHTRIWDTLDKVRAKHPDMVLIHGGSPKGAEKIASLWADHRTVPQIVFKPDWNRHKNAAPFKRNDALLDVLPIGVIAFPGSGISQNLADKARGMGIPVWKFGEGGA